MTDAYRLPDGPVAIQFSGGRTSGYMLWHILDYYDGALPPNCHVLFQNTGREMPETLDFVAECSQRWGVPITWLEYGQDEPGYAVVGHNSASRNGEPFAALIRHRGYLPNRVTRYCTTELKIRPSIRFITNALGWSQYTAVLGIRADEKHRAKDNKKERYSTIWPLIDAGVTKRNVVEWWAGHAFDLRIPADNYKTSLGNCDGCFQKSERNRAWLARYRPDLAQWWDDIESEIGGTFAQRSSWRELMRLAEAQGDWVHGLDENGSVLCTTGLGGCYD